MLYGAAWTSTIVALLGSILSVQAWERGTATVQVMTIGDWAGRTAFTQAGYAFAYAGPPSRTPEAEPGIRDLVGSVPGSEPEAALAGIGDFSFCDVRGIDMHDPFPATGGFGSEARLRQHWTAKVERFRYDLGHVDFGVLPLVTREETAPSPPVLAEDVERKAGKKVMRN